jgi:hypothetical protein
MELTSFPYYIFVLILFTIKIPEHERLWGPLPKLTFTQNKRHGTNVYMCSCPEL